jgi:hypothetical protein
MPLPAYLTQILRWVGLLALVVVATSCFTAPSPTVTPIPATPEAEDEDGPPEILGIQSAYITLAPTSGAANSSFTISGYNFSRKTALTVTWDGSAAGMLGFVSAANGNFTQAETVPSNATAGNHTVAVSGGGSASAIFQVTGAATSTSLPPPTPTITQLPTFTPTPVPSGLIGLSDNFNDYVIGSQWNTGWLEGTADNAVTLAETTQLRITPRSSFAGTAYNGYLSAITWDLTSKAVIVQAVQQAGPGTHAQTNLDIGSDSTHWFGIHWTTATDTGLSTMFFDYTDAGGVQRVAARKDYNSTADSWWRIRNSGTSILFETSPDGLSTTWVQRASTPTAWDITALRVNLIAGTFDSVASPGVAIFDNLNVPPPTGATPTATSTATATRTPTNTSTTGPTPTNTPTSTATSTFTPGATPTPTSTLVPTNTPTIIPTSTPTPNASGLISLSDNFNDSVKGSQWSTGWLEGAGDGGVLLAETSSAPYLSITPRSNAGVVNAYNGYLSSLPYNFTSRAVMVQLVQPADITTHAGTALEVGQDSTHWFKMTASDGTLLCRYSNGGSPTSFYSAPYTGGTIWWRLRQSGSLMYCETSPDGQPTTWTPLASVTSSAFAVTAMYVNLVAGTYDSVASPGVAIFDNLDYPPAAATPTPTSGATATPTPTPARSGTVYFTGDWANGNMSQFNSHQAGNQLLNSDGSKPATWDQRYVNNGNGSVVIQNAIVRPGYPYAAKFSIYPDNEVQSIIATGASSGNFTLAWGGSTSGCIAYNAGQVAIETTLNLMPSVQSAGGIVAHANNDQDGNTLNTLPGNAITIMFKDPGHGGTLFTVNNSPACGPAMSGGSIGISHPSAPASRTAANNKWGATLPSATNVSDGNDLYYGISMYFPGGVTYPQSPLLWELGFPLMSFDLTVSSQYNNGVPYSPNATSSTPYLRAALNQNGSGGFQTAGLLPDAFLWGDSVAVARNTWIDLVLHVKWSSASSGMFEVWKNGVLVHSGTGRTLPSTSGGDTGTGPQDIEIADYHGGDNSTFYAAAFRIGSSYSAVAP